MAIKPIDTEVFIQNLKQAYTILRQNILICNTMVEMISNFNSLNTTGEQNASDIEELQSQVLTINSQLASLNEGLQGLETKVEGINNYVYTDIPNLLSQKVSISENKKIIYGNAPTSATPYEYQVILSDEQSLETSDRSIPTTAWVNYKAFNIVNAKNAYFEYDGVAIAPPSIPTNISQLTGYTNFDFNNLLNCPSKIVCSNKEGAKQYVIYYPIYNIQGSITSIYYLGIYFTAVDTINMTVLKINRDNTITKIKVNLG